MADDADPLIVMGLAGYTDQRISMRGYNILYSAFTEQSM
jgi:hypothetical protein